MAWFSVALSPNISIHPQSVTCRKSKETRGGKATKESQPSLQLCSVRGCQSRKGFVVATSKKMPEGREWVSRPREGPWMGRGRRRQRGGCGKEERVRRGWRGEESC